MPQQNIYFTAGQFAQMHHLNKRTLHYYDDIGLFSPALIGENGYRYYTYQQSAELENILALREMGMSIEAIKAYLKHPSADDFLALAQQKTAEIDEQIIRLKKLQAILQKKQALLQLCASITDGQISISHYPSGYALLSPLNSSGSSQTAMAQMMAHLELAWAFSAYKTNCGSYLALDKVRKAQFDDYDGLFTLVDAPPPDTQCVMWPSGHCLCGYCIGAWSKIPLLYEKMLTFAHQEGLLLTDYAYEMGLNEFAIANQEQYVTQITIALK